MYIIKLSYRDESGIPREGEYFSGFGASYLSEYEIFDPVLESEVNAVGHFSFTVYPSHPLYDFIDKPKNLLEIVRYGENEPLFIGRMAECQTGMYNEKMLTFESELSFLIDSIRTNFVSNVEKTAKEHFESILKYHNDHSGNFGSVYTDNIQRKFQVGKISDSFSKETFTIPEGEFSGSFSTLEIISRLFLEKYGGVLKIRHENGVNLIDWLDADDIPVLSQKIVLSENLLNIEKVRNSDELVTAIRPVGENVDDNGKSKPLDLKLYEVLTGVYDRSRDIKQVIDTGVPSSSNLRFTDTLYSKSLVQKYGWIQREIKFDGIRDQTALAREAVRYLLGVSETESITVSAVDLANSKNSIDEFRAGNYAVVNSSVHGMDNRKMLIQSVSINLSDPSQSEITLGSEAESLTSQVSGGISGGSFSGSGFSGGTGKYDPEGSSAAALAAAKAYTDEKTAVKVDKVNGMGLSQENFTTAEKNKLSGLSDYDDTAVKNDISALKSGKADKSDVYTKTETDSKITGLSDRITTNKNDIAGLKTSKANKTDVYTKSETDNIITSKIAEIVADAPEEFDTLKEMSDWISNHEDSAAEMNTAIRNNSTLITALNNEIGVASKRIDGHDDDISGLQAQTKYMSEYKLDTAAFNSYKAGVREEFETVNDDITDLKSRKINGVLFDGSGDIKIGLDSCVVYDRAANWSATPWHKIASCEVTKASNQRNLTLYAERMHHPKPGGSGILRAVIRSGSSAGVFHSAYLDWEYANGQINTDNFVLVYTSDTDSKKISAELWMKITAQYESWQFKVLSMGEATISDTSYWTLYDSSSGTENYSEGSGVITSSLMGIKNNADTAETAGFADYAGTVSAVQRSVYSLSETHDNPLNIIVPLLFKAYRLVICNITTSKDSYSCMLPMQYIKSRGASRFIVNNFLMFTYVDDNTIEIRTGLAQVNPTISRVELIAVY